MAKAEQLLQDGKPAEALRLVQDQVRDDPSNAKHRVFLFQLMCVLGQWERAANQLNVLREMDPLTIPMVTAYGDAVQSEPLREAIFEGKRAPLIFGEPEPWIASMIAALELNDPIEANTLRMEALENANAVSGNVNGKAFEWIADADSRLGPVLEAVVNGKYFWVPLDRIQRISAQDPVDLRDLIWVAAELTWTNGGKSPAMLPVRYAGTSASEDGELLLSRKTVWDSPAEDVYIGRGQRLFVTEQDEVPLLEVREIVFDVELPSGEESVG